MRRLTVAAGVMIAAAWTAGAAPRQEPQFTASTRTVPVYATVTDGTGGFVLNLKKEEFEVRDNGKVQALTQFTTDNQPLSVVILIDGSASMWDIFKSVLESANSFIVRMLPGDRTAIASFSDRFMLSQTFTSDRDVLLAHLKNELNLRTGVESRVFEGLEDSLLAVEKEPNRRAVLIISDGKQWSPEGRNAFITSRTIVTHALIKDVMIYSIPMWTQFEKPNDAPSGILRLLSAETGGGVFELKEGDDIAATFTQVAKDMHQQYLLGFVPQVLDGKTHKLEVRVLRQMGGLRVRARPSYVAPLVPK